MIGAIAPLAGRTIAAKDRTMPLVLVGGERMNISMEYWRRAGGAWCARAGMEWADTTCRRHPRSRVSILWQPSRSGDERRGERWVLR